MFLNAGFDTHMPILVQYFGSGDFWAHCSMDHLYTPDCEVMGSFFIIIWRGTFHLR